MCFKKAKPLNRYNSKVIKYWSVYWLESHHQAHQISDKINVTSPEMGTQIFTKTQFKRDVIENCSELHDSAIMTSSKGATSLWLEDAMQR